MPIGLDHTIVRAKDPTASARFLSDLLGLPRPTHFGPFEVVELGNGVSLDYMHADDITTQHYAFLVSEDEFESIFDRIRERGLPFWADPGQRVANEINRHDGGRGFYWEDPDGHLLEIITRRYGSGH